MIEWKVSFVLLYIFYEIGCNGLEFEFFGLKYKFKCERGGIYKVLREFVGYKYYVIEMVYMFLDMI